MAIDSVQINATVNEAVLAGSVTQGIRKGAAAAAPIDVRVNLSGADLKKAFLPLGRITGDLNQFQSSLDASVARVLAFGASASVLSGVSSALKGIVQSGIEVEKSLQDINIILNLTGTNLSKFSDSLFEVAKNTGQSFADVSSAAVELSRQGLGAEETLKRLNDALILSRLSGLQSTEAVSTLTAAINGFQSQALSSTEIVNKLASVDQSYAVSTQDLANALSRSSAVAQDAGVSFDELIASVTAVQQVTARGGSVIGNALKSIFTRLQRSTTQQQLEEIGVATTDASGQFRGAIPILQDYAQVYQTLSDSQKASTAETIAGVYQINTLKALIGDLSNEYSIYSGALQTAASATDQANQKNAQLNQTTSALLSQTSNSLKQFGSALFSLGGEEAIRNILSVVDTLASKFSELLSPEKGSAIAQAIVGGIGNFIAGPGLAIVGGAVIKLVKFLGSEVATAFKQIQQLDAGKQKQQALEAAIGKVLQQNQAVVAKILSLEGNRTAQQQVIIGAVKQEEAALQRVLAVRQAISRAAVSGAISVNPATGGVQTGKPKAFGYIPNFASSSQKITETISAYQAGYKPGRVFNKRLYDGQGGSFNATVNSAEDIKTVMGPNGKKGTFVIPPNQQFAADGFIPNFAGQAAINADFDRIAKGQLTKDQFIAKYGQVEYNTKIRAAQTGETAAQRKAQAEKLRKLRQDQEKIITTNLNAKNKLGMVYANKGGISNANGVFNLKDLAASFNVQFEQSGYNSSKAKNPEDIDLQKQVQDRVKTYTNQYIKRIFGPNASQFNDIKQFANAGAIAGLVGGAFETAITIGTNTVLAKNGKDVGQSRRIDFPGPNQELRELFNNMGGDYEAKYTSSNDLRNDVAKKYVEVYAQKEIQKVKDIRKKQAEEIKKQEKINNAAFGYIPNFAMNSVIGAVQNAVDREKAAGIPASAIRINKSSELMNNKNPLGLAVTNTIDEPRGLLDVSKQRMMAGSGYIPNFAAGSIDIKYIETALKKFANNLPDDELKILSKLIQEQSVNYRNGSTTQKQYFRDVRAAGQQAGLSGKELQSFTRIIATTKTGLAGFAQNIGRTARSSISGGKIGFAGVTAGYSVAAGLEQSSSEAGSAIGKGLSAGLNVGFIVGQFNPLAGAITGAATALTVGVRDYVDRTKELNAAHASISETLTKSTDFVQRYLTTQESLNKAVEEGNSEGIQKFRSQLEELIAIAPDQRLANNLAAAGSSLKDLEKIANEFTQSIRKQESEAAARAAISGADPSIFQSKETSESATKKAVSESLRALGQQGLTKEQLISALKSVQQARTGGDFSELENQFKGFLDEYIGGAEDEVPAALKGIENISNETKNIFEKVFGVTIKEGNLTRSEINALNLVFSKVLPELEKLRVSQEQGRQKDSINLNYLGDFPKLLENSINAANLQIKQNEFSSSILTELSKHSQFLLDISTGGFMSEYTASVVNAINTSQDSQISSIQALQSDLFKNISEISKLASESGTSSFLVPEGGRTADPELIKVGANINEFGKNIQALSVDIKDLEKFAVKDQSGNIQSLDINPVLYKLDNLIRVSTNTEQKTKLEQIRQAAIKTANEVRANAISTAIELRKLKFNEINKSISSIAGGVNIPSLIGENGQPIPYQERLKEFSRGQLFQGEARSQPMSELEELAKQFAAATPIFSDIVGSQTQTQKFIENVIKAGEALGIFGKGAISSSADFKTSLEQIQQNAASIFSDPGIMESTTRAAAGGTLSNADFANVVKLGVASGMQQTADQQQKSLENFAKITQRTIQNLIKSREERGLSTEPQQPAATYMFAGQGGGIIQPLTSSNIPAGATPEEWSAAYSKAAKEFEKLTKIDEVFRSLTDEEKRDFADTFEKIFSKPLPVVQTNLGELQIDKEAALAPVAGATSTQISELLNAFSAEPQIQALSTNTTALTANSSALNSVATEIENLRLNMVKEQVNKEDKQYSEDQSKIDTSSIDQSANSTEQAASSTEQAASSTEQAASSTQQAANSTQQAASSTQQAASSTQQAASSTQQAASSTEQAANSLKEAADYFIKSSQNMPMTSPPSQKPDETLNKPPSSITTESGIKSTIDSVSQPYSGMIRSSTGKALYTDSKGNINKMSAEEQATIFPQKTTKQQTQNNQPVSQTSSMRQPTWQEYNPQNVPIVSTEQKTAMIEMWKSRQINQPEQEAAIREQQQKMASIRQPTWQEYNPQNVPIVSTEQKTAMIEMWKKEQMRQQELQKAERDAAERAMANSQGIGITASATQVYPPAQQSPAAIIPQQQAAVVAPAQISPVASPVAPTPSVDTQQVTEITSAISKLTESINASVSDDQNKQVENTDNQNQQIAEQFTQGVEGIKQGIESIPSSISEASQTEELVSAIKELPNEIQSNEQAEPIPLDISPLEGALASIAESNSASSEAITSGLQSVAEDIKSSMESLANTQKQPSSINVDIGGITTQANVEAKFIEQAVTDFKQKIAELDQKLTAQINSLKGKMV